MQNANSNNPVLGKQACVNSIMAVYFFSGACSLIDEVVWVRLLKLTLGNTVYATSIVVSVFLGGLALGAFIMGRYSDRVRNRLRLYALLETLVTISALSLPWFLKIADDVYIWFYRTYHPTHAQLLVVQVIISASILLVPTMLMGSTLPLLGRFVTALEKEAGHLVGKLYALNTLGAAAGCFLAGFVLIRALGVMGTLYMAAGLNLLVAFGGWFLSRFSKISDEEQADSAAIKKPEATAGKQTDGKFYLLVLAFFASGLISIGYELLWMRSIVHLLGGFTYVFSAVLTIYLIGNVIGVGIGGRLAVRLKRPAAGFAVTLFLLGLCGIFYLQFLILWTSKVLASVDKAAEAINSLVPVSPYMINPLIQSILLFMVPSVIMGIGFPLALQAWANHVHKIGLSTGTAYGVNTIGAVTGGIVTGFVLIPLLGLQLSISILGLIGLWTAGIMWLLFIREPKTVKRWAGLGAAVVLTALTVQMPSNLFDTVVEMNPRVKIYELVMVKEGLTTTVSVHRDLSTGDLHLYSSGQSIAGDNYVERGDQKMLGHFGILLNSGAEKVLSVGFGSGETTACLAKHELERVDCVEIAPEVVEVSLNLFKHINLGDGLNKEVNLIFMDAKNYLHLTDRRYDVIINDSIHPRDFAENASLYTKEYFESAKKHLNKNGMIISWLPIYDMPSSVFDSIIGTLMEVFPHVTIWHPIPHTAPLVLIAGSVQPQYFSPRHIENELLEEDVRNSLSQMNIHNSLDVLSCYIGDENDLKECIKDFSINSDYSPFVEFTTDSKTPNHRIFQRFITDVRSDSIYRHLDWSGFSEKEKEEWLADYQRIYEASTYLLLSYGTPNMLESLKYSVTGLNTFPEQQAFLSARKQASEDLFSAGIKMVLSGKEDDAVTLSDEILKIDPQSAVAWMLKSVAMQKKGQIQQALAAAQKAVQLAPDDSDVHFNLGMLWLNTGRFDKAAAEYKEALRLAEQSSNWVKIKMLNALASAYAGAGRFSDAAAVTEEALDLALSDNLKEVAEDIRKQLWLLKTRRSN